MQKPLAIQKCYRQMERFKRGLRQTLSFSKSFKMVIGSFILSWETMVNIQFSFLCAALYMAQTN